MRVRLHSIANGASWSSNLDGMIRKRFNVAILSRGGLGVHYCLREYGRYTTRNLVFVPMLARDLSSKLYNSIDLTLPAVFFHELLYACKKSQSTTNESTTKTSVLRRQQQYSIQHNQGEDVSKDRRRHLDAGATVTSARNFLPCSSARIDCGRVKIGLATPTKSDLVDANNYPHCSGVFDTVI